MLENSYFVFFNKSKNNSKTAKTRPKPSIRRIRSQEKFTDYEGGILNPLLLHVKLLLTVETEIVTNSKGAAKFLSPAYLIVGESTTGSVTISSFGLFFSL